MLYVSACLSVCSSQLTLCHSSFDSLRRHWLNIICYNSQKLVFPSHSFVIPQLFSATSQQIRHLHCCQENSLIELIFFGEQEKTSAQWQTPAWFRKITRNSILKDIFPRVRMTCMSQSYKIFNNKVHRFNIWYCFRFSTRASLLKCTNMSVHIHRPHLIQSQNQKPKKVIPLLPNSCSKYCTLGHNSFNSHHLNYLNTNNPVFFWPHQMYENIIPATWHNCMFDIFPEQPSAH